MFSRALIACLLAVALTACGAGTSFLGPSSGTVTGHVQLRACGGAYRPDQTSCQAQPMADASLVFHEVGTSNSSSVTTDSAGAYRIDLKAGTYNVRVTEIGAAKTQRPGAFADNPAAVGGSPGATTVTVVAGQTVTKDLTYTIQML